MNGGEIPAVHGEVLADHRRLVRELDVLLNGVDGAAKQASLVDLVAQARRQGVTIPSRDDARWLALGKAIERAAGELPDGYELTVEVEKGAGTVGLCDPDCNQITEFNGDTLADQVENAIGYARARADELDDEGTAG